MPLIDIEPCRDDDGSLCFMPLLTMVVCCDSTLANDGDYDEAHGGEIYYLCPTYIICFPICFALDVSLTCCICRRNCMKQCEFTNCTLQKDEVTYTVGHIGNNNINSRIDNGSGNNDYIFNHKGNNTNEKCTNAQCKNQEKLMHCTGCMQVKYCCQDCQVKDWDSHKLLCIELNQKSRGKANAITSSDQHAEKDNQDNNDDKNNYDNDDDNVGIDNIGNIDINGDMNGTKTIANDDDAHSNK